MAITALKAWTIFKAASLGQEEGNNAINALTMSGDTAEYEAHVADFDLALTQAVVKVQNEGAALLNGSPVIQAELGAKPPHEWIADDYRDLVGIFEGSEFEKLHLSAFFRIQNVELLFDLIKPAVSDPLSDHDEDLCSSGESMCYECYAAGADSCELA